MQFNQVPHITDRANPANPHGADCRKRNIPCPHAQIVHFFLEPSVRIVKPHDELRGTDLPVHRVKRLVYSKTSNLLLRKKHSLRIFTLYCSHCHHKSAKGTHPYSPPPCHALPSSRSSATVAGLLSALSRIASCKGYQCSRSSCQAF